MMKPRNPVLVAVFSIITLGIYFLYWLHVIRRGVNAKVEPGARAWSVLWLLSPFLLSLAVLIVYTFLNASRLGEPLHTIINVVIFTATTVAIGGTFLMPLLWFYRFSRSLSAYTDGYIGVAGNYIMFLVLSFFGFAVIWQGITQHLLNEASGGNTPGQTQPQPPGYNQ